MASDTLTKAHEGELLQESVAAPRATSSPSWAPFAVIRTPKTAKHLRWNVLLVDVPDAMASACEAILAPLIMVRVGKADVLEQLPQVQPLLACAPHCADIGWITLLRQRTTDVGAVFVIIPEDCDPAELERLLKHALVEAEAKSQST